LGKAKQGQGKVSSKQHPSDAGRRRVVVDGWTGSMEEIPLVQNMYIRSVLEYMLDWFYN